MTLCFPCFTHDNLENFPTRTIFVAATNCVSITGSCSCQYFIATVRYTSKWLKQKTSKYFPLFAAGRYSNQYTWWKHFPRYWPFVRLIHRSPVNSPHRGQWRVTLMFSSIYVWINGWVDNREAGDLRRYRAHYDVIVMFSIKHHQQSVTLGDRIPRPIIINVNIARQ